MTRQEDACAVRAGTEERLAAAAWSRIAEPGDVAAGALRQALGPVAALRWLRRTVQAGELDRLPAELIGAGLPADPEPWRAAVARWAPRLDYRDPRRDLDALASLGGLFVVPGDDQWPAQLDDLGLAAPPALWLRGEARLPAASDCAALVGARASTSYGEHVAAQLAVGLADAGSAVCSGGAYGIDAAAHRGALAADGLTVAVLAGGVDRLYPAGNTDLLREIAGRGVLVAEVPPGIPPARFRFLQRNRIIAALSGATVVVEAAWRSGALSTATHAAELLRPVGAVPGPVTSMASAGCHRLMRERDAVCVTQAADVVELLEPVGTAVRGEPGRQGQPERGQQGGEQQGGGRIGHGGPMASGQGSIFDDLDEAAYRVLDALPVRAARTIPAIVAASGLGSQEVRAAVGRLELAGRIERSDGGWRRSR